MNVAAHIHLFMSLIEHQLLVLLGSLIGHHLLILRCVCLGVLVSLSIVMWLSQVVHQRPAVRMVSMSWSISAVSFLSSFFYQVRPMAWFVNPKPVHPHVGLSKFSMSSNLTSINCSIQSCSIGSYYLFLKSFIPWLIVMISSHLCCHCCTLPCQYLFRDLC